MKPMQLPLHPLALAALLACHTAPHAQTLPGTATIVNGVVDVQRFSNGVQVTNTPGAIVHWDRFSISAGNTVRFVQQGPASAVLNRVTGNTPSQIHGALQSNGRVFLLNPNGILFGAGARVDVAGLLASTLDIADQDFLDGKYHFKCFNAIACEGGVDALNPVNNRIVLEDGSQITTRTAGEGGQVWLIARDRVITEKGSRIEAPSGQVMAAAAREVSITSPALGQMRFTLTGTAGSRIDMAGDIAVPRGAAGFFADSIRLNGTVNARSDVGAAGQIIASAGSSLTLDGDARLDVSGNAGADAGAVRLAATQSITVAPTSETAADGGLPTASQPAPLGGLIDLDAYQINLPWAIGSGAPDGSSSFFSFSYQTGATHAPLHAGAQGAAVGNVQRHGIVRVRESGAFTIEQTDVNLRFETNYTTGSGSTAVFEQVLAAIPSVGQDLLLVSGVDGAIGQQQVKLRVLSPTGQVSAASAIPLSASSVAVRALPLGQGGWLVLLGSNPLSVVPVAPRVVVVGADGSVLREIAIAGTAADEAAGSVFDRVWAIQGGGFAITSQPSGSPLTTLYTASGAVDVQAPAGRAGAEQASRALLAARPYADKASVNYDARLQLRSRFSSDFSTVVGEQLVDRVSGEARFEALLPPLAGPSAFNVLGGMLAPKLWWGEVSTEDSNVRRTVLTAPDGSVLAVLGSTQGSSTGVEQSTLILTGSGSGLALQSVSTGSQSGGVGSFNDTQTMKLFRRVPVAMPFAATGAVGDVVVPLLLAAQPGRTNGTLGGLVGTPTFPSDTTTPTPIPAPTSPGIPPTTGTPPTLEPTPPAPVAGDIPPPPYQPATRPAGTQAPLPGSVIDVARLRTGDVAGGLRRSDANGAFLNSARDVVREILGEEAVAAFNRGNDAQRSEILNEAAWVQAINDPDLQAATRDMGRDMRGATLNAMAALQRFDTLESDALREGLRKALSVKVDAPKPDDGSAPDRARTPLETELQILEAELFQADRARMIAEGQGAEARVKAEQEHRLVTGRIARAMVIAAREAAGETVDDSGNIEIGGNNSVVVVLTKEGALRELPR